MMSRRIFSFDPPDRFVCGTVGQPGQRTFFLQASKGSQVVSVALEKTQVAVLAERLALLLLALRDRGVALADDHLVAGDLSLPELDEPIIEEFRVGALTLAWDADRERIVIEARELTGEEDDGEDEPPEPLSGAGADVAGGALGDVAGADGPDMVRVLLEPAAAHTFVNGAVAAVQSGRPPCPMCGEPLDAAGHFCTRRNGYAH